MAQTRGGVKEGEMEIMQEPIDPVRFPKTGTNLPMCTSTINYRQAPTLNKNYSLFTVSVKKKGMVLC